MLVYRPNGGRPIDTIYGFSFISGVAVGRDGSLYVSELFFGGDPTNLAAPVGQVTKVAPNGERTAIPVPFPGGVAVDRWYLVHAAAEQSMTLGLVPRMCPQSLRRVLEERAGFRR